MAAAKATIDHDEIRQWVEARGGVPARLQSRHAGDEPERLRIDFPGGAGKRARESISWEEFFAWFDDSELAFVYQERNNGRSTRFAKLVRRDRVVLPVSELPPSLDAHDRDPVGLLLQQHDHLRELFARYQEGEAEVLDELLDELALHLTLEEAIVYPALIGSALEERVYESMTEHLSVRRLVADLIEGTRDDAVFAARVRVLQRQIEEHMEDEESDVLPEVERICDDDEKAAMAQELVAFMAELTEGNADAPLESLLSNAGRATP
jgi:hemerythrin superfamily protein